MTRRLRDRSPWWCGDLVDPARPAHGRPLSSQAGAATPPGAAAASRHDTCGDGVGCWPLVMALALVIAVLPRALADSDDGSPPFLGSSVSPRAPSPSRSVPRS